MTSESKAASGSSCLQQWRLMHQNNNQCKDRIDNIIPSWACSIKNRCDILLSAFKVETDFLQKWSPRHRKVWHLTILHSKLVKSLQPLGACYFSRPPSGSFTPPSNRLIREFTRFTLENSGLNHRNVQNVKCADWTGFNKCQTSAICSTMCKQMSNMSNKCHFLSKWDTPDGDIQIQTVCRGHQQTVQIASPWSRSTQRNFSFSVNEPLTVSKIFRQPLFESAYHTTQWYAERKNSNFLRSALGG